MDAWSDPDILRLRYMRHVYSVQGWALLIYYWIMNVAVSLVVMVFTVIFTIVNSFGDGTELALLEDRVLASSGWGYFLAIAIGMLLLFLWKKREFCCKTIWARGKAMKLGSFIAILSVFMSVQMLSLLLSVASEWVMELLGIGYDMGEGITMDSWGMFLYVGLGAPVAEEILFRGLMLRSIQPFGKKFAIFVTALLFGLFHGNMSQAPFAFCVGLVLGYVTLEYNILWAIVLHMFNNLLITDTLFRVGQSLIGSMGEALVWGAIACFTVVALIVLLVRRKQIAAYLRQEYDDPLCKKAFFTAPGVIVLLIVLIGLTLITELSYMSFTG